MSEQIRTTVHAGGFFLLLKDSENWRFLLLRHADRWDLPKGHCEPGESFLDAAIRELEEETSIRRKMIELDPSFTFELSYKVHYKKPVPQTCQKVVRYFLAYLYKPPRIELTEHLSASWFEWRPDKQIQAETIDSVISAVAIHLENR